MSSSEMMFFCNPLRIRKDDLSEYRYLRSISILADKNQLIDNMIHDIHPHQFSNHYQAESSLSEDAYILHYNDRNILLKNGSEGYEIPRWRDISADDVLAENVFLFSLNGTDCFLLWDIPETLDPGLVFEDLNFFRTCSHIEFAWISLVGFHLRNWYVHNRYCGKCGERTEHKHDERALICPACNHLIFPFISPAIIVAIVSQNKILLARNHRFSGGWYSLIAGYSDVGESLEETLIREVKEEVGLDVRNIRYYKSQPWPLSGSMMVGFIAEADEDQPLCPDGIELSDAAWFSRGSLPEYPSTLSIAGEMIELFDRGLL